MIWDPAKDKANRKKHDVSFADAELALWDPNALTIEDPESKNEQRFITLGSDSIGRVLIVVYTYVGRHVRLISARKASPGEIKKYEK